MGSTTFLGCADTAHADCVVTAAGRTDLIEFSVSRNARSCKRRAARQEDNGTRATPARSTIRRRQRRRAVPLPGHKEPRDHRRHSCPRNCIANSWRRRARVSLCAPIAGLGRRNPRALYGIDSVQPPKRPRSGAAESRRCARPRQRRGNDGCDRPVAARRRQPPRGRDRRRSAPDRFRLHADATVRHRGRSRLLGAAGRRARRVPGFAAGAVVGVRVTGRSSRPRPPLAVAEQRCASTLGRASRTARSRRLLERQADPPFQTRDEIARGSPQEHSPGPR